MSRSVLKQDAVSLRVSGLATAVNECVAVGWRRWRSIGWGRDGEMTALLDSSFPLCSHPGMAEWGELSFKVVRLETAGQEVLARAGNILVARAAFEISVSLYQTDEIELRQGSRVICSSKRDTK